MKWRPRLSIPLGKGFRINIGRRGIGASAGIPGVARFGVGSDGRTRTSVGKGLLRWEHQGGGKKQPGGCGCGGCFLMLILGIGVFAVIGALMPKNDSSASVTPSASAPPKPVAATSRVPLFREPLKAASLPISMGLKDTAVGKAVWRAGESGWYALATVVTHEGGLSKPGDVNNGIDCFHESRQSSQVEGVTWTAKVFNPAGQAATLPRFKELCLKYAAQLGCPLPAGLFEKVDPEKGQRLETADAVFEIEKLNYNQGFGWRFRVTAR
jgi:hypothetical protein